MTCSGTCAWIYDEGNSQWVDFGDCSGCECGDMPTSSGKDGQHVPGVCGGTPPPSGARTSDPGQSSSRIPIVGLKTSAGNVSVLFRHGKQVPLDALVQQAVDEFQGSPPADGLYYISQETQTEDPPFRPAR